MVAIVADVASVPSDDTTGLGVTGVVVKQSLVAADWPGEEDPMRLCIDERLLTKLAVVLTLAGAFSAILDTLEVVADGDGGTSGTGGCG